MISCQKIPYRFDLLILAAIEMERQFAINFCVVSYVKSWFIVKLICVQGRGEVEVGAGKGLMDKSSTATTTTAHLEAIRKREKRKQAQLRFLVKNFPWILFAVGTCATC